MTKNEKSSRTYREGWQRNPFRPSRSLPIQAELSATWPSCSPP